MRMGLCWAGCVLASSGARSRVATKLVFGLVFGESGLPLRTLYAGLCMTFGIIEETHIAPSDLEISAATCRVGS